MRMFCTNNSIFRFIFIVIFLLSCTPIEKNKRTEEEENPIYEVDASLTGPYSFASIPPESGTQSSASIDSGVKKGSVLDEATAYTENPEAGSGAPNDSGNCTEQQFYIDSDKDGFGDPADSVTSCESPPGYVAASGDCDDNCVTCFPGATESCGNNKDDNCDGTVDENCPCTQGEERQCGEDEGECEFGVQRCVDGEWSNECEGAKTKSEEICDSLDNDCDGQTDEDIPGTGESCDGSDTDLCKEGTMQCNGTAMVCSDTTGDTAEVCDTARVDEDCDGAANENCTCSEGDTQECGKNIGICRTGVQRCVNGSYSSTCEGEVLPDPRGEICDQARLDEDCDGVLNENCDCYNGEIDNECGPSNEIGECEFGTRTCSSGRWGGCSGETMKETETCNGLDDDCDGVTDNNDAHTECPTNEECVSGNCTCVRPNYFCERNGKCITSSECCNCNSNEWCKTGTQCCQSYTNPKVDGYRISISDYSVSKYCRDLGYPYPNLTGQNTCPSGMKYYDYKNSQWQVLTCGTSGNDYIVAGVACCRTDQ